jgi:hypothetical protein
VPSEAEPDLSGKPCPTELCVANPVRAAHAEFIAVLAEHPPRTIPLDADAIDLEDRADHLDKVLSALSVYLTVILDDTAQNVPGRLDLPHIEAVLSDLASGVAGMIAHATEGGSMLEMGSCNLGRGHRAAWEVMRLQLDFGCWPGLTPSGWF